MKRWTLSMAAMLALALSEVPLMARDIHIHPDRGDDTAAGDSAHPVQTIAQAIRLAQPGDTVHLAPARYKESAVFANRSGEPGRPITLDGHGATLDGAEPLKPEEWETASPGLYRNRNLLPMSPAILGRWYFVFGGKMNHMGRTSKGPSQKLKKPEDLAPGEWTYIPDAPITRESKDGRPWDAKRMTGAFYIKTKLSEALADCRIEAPMRANGVAISGECHHLVIRNLIATHVYNDGYNIHGTTRDILFENIRAIDCGDDGFSAHDDCEVRVNGLVSTGNSTGICNGGRSTSVSDRVFVRDCLGYDFYVIGSNAHVLRNSLLIGHAAQSLVVAGDGGPCTLKMENVLIRGTGRSTVLKANKDSVVDASHVTLYGMGLSVAGQTFALRHSIVAGVPKPHIVVFPKAQWATDQNLYDLRQIEIAQTAYGPKDFARYQQATQQDRASQWTQVQFREPFDGSVESPTTLKDVGADPSLMSLEPKQE